MHASFFHEEAPKSAIIIKGISDRASSSVKEFPLLISLQDPASESDQYLSTRS